MNRNLRGQTNPVQYRRILFHRSLWQDQREGRKERQGHLCQGLSHPGDNRGEGKDVLHRVW